MEQRDKRRRDVFIVADLFFAATAFTFVHYNFVQGQPLVSVLQALGGLAFIALAAIVHFKQKYLKAASWFLVILTAGFMLCVMFFFKIRITNVVWMVFPYFMSMLLLGFRNGMVVSAVYLIASNIAVFVRFPVVLDDFALINQVSISIASACAFAFAAYYEKARAKNEDELLAKHRAVERMSHLDDLTGLFNRRFFDRALHQEFHRAKREHQSVALIFLDVDLFKNYNDTFGHLQGDACLGEVACAISASIARSTDTATRFGGDEFAILLPNTNRVGGQLVAERIMKIIQEKAIPHTSSDVSSVVTLSLGIALLSQDGDRNPTDLIRRADQALYISKKNGRNRITFA